MARDYAEAIVNKEIPACRYVQLACERYLMMLAKAGKPRIPYYFSTEWAVDVCDFAEMMPHLEGVWETDNIVLEPCQCFWLIAIFAFRRKSNDHRLVSHVYMEIPRKSGKSLLIAVILLYCFLNEGESGSQIYIGAPKEEQADKVYNPIKAMVDSQSDLKEHYALKTTLKKISKLSDDIAFIKKISSNAETEDGHNPHVVAMEELHAQKPELYEVMDSATGARANLLFVSIGTAGRLASGIGWEERKKLIRVLEGKETLIHWWGIVYTLDPEDYEDDEDNLLSEDIIRKANPMYNVSVLPERVKEFLQNSRGNTAKMIEVKRTRFNIWSGAAGDLIALHDWQKCADPDLNIEDFYGLPAYVGGDLSSKNDFTAIVLLVEKDGILYAFEEVYIPEATKSFAKESVGNLWRGWVDDGLVHATHGAIVNYGEIELQIREWCERFDVQAIVFDKYQSNQILSNLYDDGLPAMQMSPGTINISDPTKDLVAQIQAGTMRHRGSPVTEWMAMNVKGYYDTRDNVLPKKESPNSDYKIDVFAAMVMANAARTDADLEIETPWQSVYEQRGAMLGAETLRREAKEQERSNDDSRRASPG